MIEARRRRNLALFGALTAIYLAVFFGLDGLRFELRRDEVFFWPTVQRFSETLFSNPVLLRDYQQFVTPFAFVVFGTLEHLFGGGISAARGFNLLVSFAVACSVGWPRPDSDRRAPLAVVGLLVFPYFLGTSTHLYTDVLAAGLVLLGFAAYRSGAHAVSALVFVFAIATRQFALAFPLAIAFEQWRRNGIRPRATWLPLVSASSIGIWIWIFGGLAPPSAMSAQQLSDAGFVPPAPQYAIYFLACVGAYFVSIERLLLRGQAPRLGAIGFRSGAWIAVVLALLVWFFPPLENVGYPIPSMGLLDRAARSALGDVPRMLFFYGLALLACLRFARPGLPSTLVWANAAIMLQAQVGWDKYVLPLLVVLWFLVARGGAGGGSASINPRIDSSVVPARAEARSP